MDGEGYLGGDGGGLEGEFEYLHRRGGLWRGFGIGWRLLGRGL